MDTHFYVLAFTLFLAMCVVKAEDTATRNCANAKMDSCNQIVKGEFIKAAGDSTDTRTDLQVYCDAMRALFHCVKTQIQDSSNTCKTNKLRKYYFIVLAYLKMDKLMGTCTQDVTDIKTAVLDDLPTSDQTSSLVINGAIARMFGANPDITQDARDVHTFCVKKFTGNEKSSTNLCSGVREFISCYVANSGGNPTSVAFAALINQMSNELINAFETDSKCTAHSDL